ncbi:conserved protein of unknown function [Methylococcus capsulatus]|uniref:Uncharacterized protein n=1 Tax=Methylococcus capsulatus TaxID=414 RepID=A0AA35UG31_METCP|nr:hypothetical protein [Methylococcus capsulatus]CAI8743137.1 conserved protein of unknown function [Methylococcus capsulatus]
MNAIWTVYQPSTGRILELPKSIPDAYAHLYLGPDRHVIEGAWYPDRHYIGPVGALERPPQETSLDTITIRADGEDVATLSRLPDPCTVEIYGPVRDVIEVEGGVLEFCADVPGRYELVVKAFPWLDFTGMIHAL